MKVTRCKLDILCDKDKKLKRKVKKQLKIDRNQPLLFQKKQKEIVQIKKIPYQCYYITENLSTLKTAFLFDEYCLLFPEIQAEIGEIVQVEKVDDSIITLKIIWAGFKLQSDEIRKLETMSHGICSCHIYVMIPENDENDWTFCFRFTCSKTKKLKCKEIFPDLLKKIIPKVIYDMPSENKCFRKWEKGVITLPIIPPIYFKEIFIASREYTDQENKNRIFSEKNLFQKMEQEQTEIDFSIEDVELGLQELETETEIQLKLDQIEKPKNGTKKSSTKDKLSKFSFVNSEAKEDKEKEEEEEEKKEEKKSTRKKWSSTIEEKRTVISSKTIKKNKKKEEEEEESLPKEIPEKLELKIREDFDTMDISSQSAYQKTKNNGLKKPNGIKKKGGGGGGGDKDKKDWDKKKKAAFLKKTAQETCFKKAFSIRDEKPDKRETYISWFANKSEEDIKKMVIHFLQLGPYLLEKKMFTDPTDKMGEEQLREFVVTNPALDAFRVCYMLFDFLDFDHHSITKPKIRDQNVNVKI
jgi:hypothetical protein